MSSNHHWPKRSADGAVSLQVLQFAILCVLCGLGVLAYVLYSRQPRPPTTARNARTFSTDPRELLQVRRRAHLLFRDTTIGPHYGRVSVVSLDALDGVRYVTALPCERVYGAVGAGICLQATRGVFTTFKAASFGPDFQVIHTFDLPGTPSRTRVSPNGRLAATTVFVRGDSYNSGGFSTRTSLFDLPEGQLIGDLEEFSVLKDGEVFRRADFNFWGVTFAADGERFFATLGTGDVRYLVEGRISDRTLRVIRDGVECPSLSPDGTRLAFKSRVAQGGNLIWKLCVLNLNTGAETSIRGDHGIDDQAEWLDREHVLYALPRNVAGSAASDIWVVNTDGSGTPRLFVTDAFSPCVVRP